MFLSLGYLALRCLLQLVLLRPRSEGFKELEIVVLRHEPVSAAPPNRSAAAEAEQPGLARGGEPIVAALGGLIHEYGRAA